jgi:glutamine cyclotransferase
MSKVTAWLGCLLFLSACVTAASCTQDTTRPPVEDEPLVWDDVPLYTYRVLHTYPHDSNAFTQGLVFEDGRLYEGTGLYGQSTLRRVDLLSGRVLQSVDLPADRFGEGIALFEGRIFQLTYVAHLGFIYDRETFERVGQFRYGTPGWGLTHDGYRLIMSDGTDKLYFLDPESFAVVRQVEVRDRGEPVWYLNELEYIDGRVFANIWRYNDVVVIDPATGQVTSRIDLSGLLAPEDITPVTDVLNGIAFDAAARRLFVTGKRWPKLFEIRLVPADAEKR